MTHPYQTAKELARQVRAKYGLATTSINLSALRKIYRSEGIKIDMWELSKNIRAVYMCDDDDPSVLVNSQLPKIPRLFAMAHELKHHLCDRDLLEGGQINCGDYNSNRQTEIAAEIFAAELIYPESEFMDHVKQMGLQTGSVQAEDIVRLKRETAVPVSYQFLCKRFEFAGLTTPGQFAKTQFVKLEEKIYGTPFYKQKWFKDYRARRSSRKQSGLG